MSTPIENNTEELQEILNAVNELPDAGSGENGATFTPSVSEDGTLSWTNDKGLPNPDPVNIMGPQGKQGIQGIRGLQGIGVVSVTIEEVQ
jgi:hypothetical protein